MRYPKVIFFLFTLFACTSTRASHLVGGDITMRPNAYRSAYEVTLTTYFDDINGEPGAFQNESEVNPYIFRKSDGELMQMLTLEVVEFADFVPFSLNDCAIESYATRIIVFSGWVELPADVYNDPEGYIIVWERCCKNSTITNIQNPLENGVKFTLEFPPVAISGSEFRNASPIISDPSADYACVNNPFYLNFKARDEDGDSLAYSLVTPYVSTTAEPIPTPNVDTFAEVTWADDLGVDNIIPGNPTLKIDQNGMLTVTPTFVGNYLFTVQVDEFRAGEKIGQVRRDFQIPVIDLCDEVSYNSPLTTVLLNDQSEYNEADTLFFNYEDEKCISLSITNPFEGVEIELLAVGNNFDAVVDQSIFASNNFFLGQDENRVVEVCLSDCPYIPGSVFQLDLIASRNLCPQPQRDTVTLKIQMESPPNTAPEFTNAEEDKSISLERGQTLSETITAQDMDGDDMQMKFVANGYIPADYGLSISEESNTSGEYSGTLLWNPNCATCSLNSSTQFVLAIVLFDMDQCEDNKNDTLMYTFDYVHIENSPPVITFIPDIIVTDELVVSGIEFSIDDDFTPIEDLTVSVSSSNQNLVRNEDISLTTDNQKDYSIDLTLQPEVYEETTITVEVSDEESTSTESFNISSTLVSSTRNERLDQVINVYPNPSDGPITVELPAHNTYNLEVLNINGQSVWHRRSFQGDQFELNLESWHKGIFFLKVQADKKTWVVRILR